MVAFLFVNCWKYAGSLYSVQRAPWQSNTPEIQDFQPNAHLYKPWSTVVKVMSVKILTGAV